jgi:hypothetical protein
LTGLDKSVLKINTKIVSFHTANSKPVKQEVNGTVIFPPLVFPALSFGGQACWAKMTSTKAGSAKANRREPKTCLGQVFSYKLGCFEDVLETHVCGRTPTSIVENLAQVLSC